MIAIITSKLDPAGVNLAEELKKHNIEKYDARLYEIEERTVLSEHIDKKIDAELFIFATRHQSKSQIKSLSVHSPGNWNKAEAGGQDRKVCLCPADYLKEALIFLEKNNTIGFDVIQECTHHGPYIEKPCFFIEIGSTEEEWKNKDAAKIIVTTILHLLEHKPKQHRTALGIGGLHTTPNFKKIILNSGIAIGHVCPKYMLEFLDKELIERSLERTFSKADLIILDWKGLGEHKQKITEILKEIDVEVKRTSAFE
jgi:D-aminoacyl-tRNA deacylase